jgi:aminotransferase
MHSNSALSLRNRIAHQVRDIPRSGIRDFFDIVSTMKDVISLGIGEPDFDTPWHVRESTVFSLERGATHYTSNLGYLELRKALGKYVGKNFAADYNPDTEILVTVGVSEALDIALRALINPGDEVLFHEPCYVSYRATILFAHGVPVAVVTKAENGFRLTRAMLEAKVTPKTKVLMLNFPNNPTGGVMDRKDLEDIAAFARERDLIVITDEIYAELTYDTAHTSIVSLPGMKERTIFLHGFSKAWAMTGFRLGYACGPAELIEAMMKIHQYTMLCASSLAQKAAIEALVRPEVDVGEMVAEYRRRRNFIAGAFVEMGLECHRPLGAFYAFPSVAKFKIPAKEFALRLLQEEKVAVVPGTAFGDCGEGFVRCAYATNLENIKEAMIRLQRFIGKL